MSSDWERQAEQKALQRQLAKERRSEADDLTTKKEKSKMTKGRKKRTKTRDTTLSPTKNRSKPMGKKKTKAKGSKAKRAGKGARKLGRFAGKVVGKTLIPIMMADRIVKDKSWRGGVDVLKEQAEYLTCTGDDDNNMCSDLGFAKGGLVNAKGTKVKQCRGGGKATRGLNFTD